MAKPVRGSDAARAMNGLRRLVRALRVGDARIHRAAGISSAQLFALRQISRRSGQSLSDLAASTLTTQSSISEVVARLIDAGLVARNVADDDHRRTELALTNRGRSVLSNSPQTPQEKVLAALLSLTPRTQQLLADSIEEWLGSAQLADAEAKMFFEA